MYKTYINILKEDLIPAFGCTEPIAIAYAAANAREILGDIPDKIIVKASGSIIKNVKSVIVPNTNHLRGIEAAAAVGVIAGDASKELEVISEVSSKEMEMVCAYLENTPIEVYQLENSLTFELVVTVFYSNHQATVRIANHHTNIVNITKDAQTVFAIPIENESDSNLTDRSCMNIKDIYEFSKNVNLSELKDIIHKQIMYNSKIAEEGLLGNYGANIGKILLKSEGNNVRTRAKAMAAAASDARMNGCELPVIINSGSGNQGITCCIPVIEYAKELDANEEQLYRALILSNLVAIYVKNNIGRLSAFCGAVSAGVAAGAGITYLYGYGCNEINHTIVNALAITSGIICDGAKASCAAKIAMSVDAGILGFEMYKNGQEFYSGDGIVAKGVDATIKNIGYLGKDGMRETNQTIIDMMLKC